MEVNRCMKCMTELKSSGGYCPNCGHKNGSEAAIPFAMKPNTILHGRYLVGCVIGQGGFGITYIGYDLVLNSRVAIKEYFPRSMGSRNNSVGNSISWDVTGEMFDSLKRGRTSFINEARKMARVSDIPEVVRVIDAFEENGTSYIVMDYVEGETLKSYIKRNGIMSFDEVVGMLLPLMKGLARLHRMGIVHRDISPDNIMIRTDGSVRLLDLGAAKDISAGDASQLVVKKSFSPFEQYSGNGSTGPWSDVYSFAATMYYCITGACLPEAIDRIMNDKASLDVKMKKPLTPAQKSAMARALAPAPEKRTRNMDEFIAGLTGGAVQPSQGLQNGPMPYKNPERPQNKNKRPLIIAASVLAVCIIGMVTGMFIYRGIGGSSSGSRVTDTSWVNNVMCGSSDVSTDEYVLTNNSYTRNDIVSVTFTDTLKNKNETAWDVSGAKNGSVMAWVEPAEKSGGKYNLYIGANGGINGKDAAEDLFYNYENVLEINFNGCFRVDEAESLSRMMYNCSSLTQADMTGFNTSKCTDFNSMFAFCESLKSIDVTGFDTSNADSMMDMFDYCSSLEELDVSGFNTSKVTNFGSMFSSCEKLKSIDVTGFDTSSAKDMSGMFSFCRSLESIDVSGFNTSNAERMSFMFCFCDLLKTIDVSGFDTSKVKDMSNMFADCKALSSIDVSGFALMEDVDITDMFEYCNSLTGLPDWAEAVHSVE